MDRDVKIAYDELNKVASKRMKRQKTNAARQASSNSPFYSLEQVLELVPVSRSTLYLMMSDDEFPHQIKLGKRSAAWSKKEVNAWIDVKLNG